ncbi:protein of unknown function [Methanocaldococcus lauensis]|uniref:Uncharacterized protein n=1 Tax=Methanocaldococcus lauensis TaxID=2546128 RepID=A0A8D6SVV7_9EURY|nr:protein of unknown function [Methanocaldococcus lauensis]
MCSGGVVRSIMRAFRARDPGSNPGRSIIYPILIPIIYIMY